jgi:predicted aldo/keto reductase-like oxidoreductase
MCTLSFPRCLTCSLGLQDVQWTVENSRVARKLARTPHTNQKKKKPGETQHEADTIGIPCTRLATCSDLCPDFLKLKLLNLTTFLFQTSKTKITKSDLCPNFLDNNE